MDCLFVPLLNQEHNNPFFPQGDLELKFPPISKEKEDKQPSVSVQSCVHGKYI